ncbi:MFS transporter [Reyranella sp.]|uniref:MFS transporter n=1 Tax=Reyranella sp. TaxID=1929291 RepID=UPI003BAA2ECB
MSVAKQRAARLASSGATGERDGPAGWRVAWAAFIVAVFGWGVGFYGPGVYLAALHDRHGWSISTVSAAITAHYLTSAALIAGLPNAYRRFSVARVTIAGAVFAAAGAVAWTSAREVWQLVPALLLSGLGWSAMSGAALNAMVSPWFDRDRPRAMSTAFNGASVGGLLFTPLWAGLIAAAGLPVAGIVVAVTTVLVVCPLAWCLLRRQPGAEAGAGAAAAPTSRRTLLRQPRFVTLSAAFALGLFAQIGLFAHLISRLAPEFGEATAALAISLATLCAVIGRTLMARALGGYDRRVAAAANFAMQAVGSLLLALGAGAPVLALGCVLFGLGVGNLTSLPPLIAQREFRPADVGMVVALLTAINQAVFAFAPAVFGGLRDLAGGYIAAFLLAAIVQILAAAIVAGGSRHDLPIS